MRPVVNQCVRKRKEFITEDIQLVLNAIKKCQIRKADCNELNSEGLKESLQRLEVIFEYLPDLIEAIEAAPEIMNNPRGFMLFKFDYLRSYRKLIQATSGKVYPLKSNRSRGTSFISERRKVCADCMNSRCKFYMVPKE